MKKVNVLLAVIAGMSIGIICAMSDKHLISLPDAYTIRKHLDREFSDFIIATDMHRVLGGRTISKQYIIDEVNSQADWAQKTVALIIGKVSKEERKMMVQAICKLDLNKQAKL
jgi:hypothetical protein